MLTVSDFAAREIAEVLHSRRTRIRVAGEAPAAAFRPDGSTRGDPAGGGAGRSAAGCALVDVRRRIQSPQARGRHRARSRGGRPRSCAAPPHLLLVGTIDKDVFHGDQANIRRAIAEAGTEALVHWTGFVPDEELRHLHSGAVALVLPSASEGLRSAGGRGGRLWGAGDRDHGESAAGTARGRRDLRPARRRSGAGRRAPSDAQRRAGPAPRMGAVARERAAALSWPRAAAAALAALTRGGGVSGLRFCVRDDLLPAVQLRRRRDRRSSGWPVALVKAGHRVTVIHDVDAYNVLHKGAEPAPQPEPEGLEVVRLRSGARDPLPVPDAAARPSGGQRRDGSRGSWTRESSTSSTFTTSRWSAGRGLLAYGPGSSCTWPTSTGSSAPRTCCGGTAGRSAPAASA